MELERVDYTLWGGNLLVDAPEEWGVLPPPVRAIDGQGEDENEEASPQAPANQMQAPEELREDRRDGGAEDPVG